MIYHATCKGYHATILDARSCGGIGYGGETLPPPTRPQNVAIQTGRQASFKQENFVRALYAERDPSAIAFDGNLEERLFDILGNPTETEILKNPDLRDSRKYVAGLEASAIISELLSIPRAAPESRPKSERAPDVPAGRYALASDDGVVRFYKIDKPDSGRWKGYTFIKGLYGSPGDFREERLARSVGAEVMKAIAKDVEGSARLFGRKFKRCGHCLSPLSDPQSRASGYGETCAGNHGYWYATLKEALVILAELGE